MPTVVYSTSVCGRAARLEDQPVGKTVTARAPAGRRPARPARHRRRQVRNAQDRPDPVQQGLPPGRNGGAIESGPGAQQAARPTDTGLTNVAACAGP